MLLLKLQIQCFVNLKYVFFIELVNVDRLLRLKNRFSKSQALEKLRIHVCLLNDITIRACTIKI